jgi:hypothetical protein
MAAQLNPAKEIEPIRKIETAVVGSKIHNLLFPPAHTALTLAHLEWDGNRWQTNKINSA